MKNSGVKGHRSVPDLRMRGPSVESPGEKIFPGDLSLPQTYVRTGVDEKGPVGTLGSVPEG